MNNTELIVGAINPGYGGLPIGVAAALGGARALFLRYLADSLLA